MDKEQILKRIDELIEEVFENEIDTLGDLQRELIDLKYNATKV